VLATASTSDAPLPHSSRREAIQTASTLLEAGVHAAQLVQYHLNCRKHTFIYGFICFWSQCFARRSESAASQANLISSPLLLLLLLLLPPPAAAAAAAWLLLLLLLVVQGCTISSIHRVVDFSLFSCNGCLCEHCLSALPNPSRVDLLHAGGQQMSLPSPGAAVVATPNDGIWRPAGG
jgi:hypothetical protein